MARALMDSLSPARDTTRALAVSLALALVANASAQAPSVQFSSLVYPPDSYEEVDGKKTLCFRAVDGMTGAALPQAELFLIAESDHPVRGEFSFQQCLAPDADGFFRIPLDPNLQKGRTWHWLMVRAPGFGQRMEMDALDDVTVLAPAIDMPLQVFNAFGQPVADCHVGFCSGCGHTPDLVSARTDANGQCMLPGIDTLQGIRDVYLEHQDLGLFYEECDWFPGEPPARIEEKFAISLRGTVVDADGKPIANAHVGYKDVHRGPWTRTGNDGAFLLCGIEDRPTELWVHVGERELLVDLDAETPVRLKVPPAPAEPVNGTELVNLPVGVRSREDADNELPPFPDRSWPTVPVRLVHADENCTVDLVTRTRRADVSELLARGEPLPLPDEPFAFVVDGLGKTRTFPTDRAKALAEGVVRLPWYRPTRIEGRVVDEAGQPLEAKLALLTPHEAMTPRLDDVEEAADTAGSIQLQTEREGLALLAVISQDREHTTRIVPVLLPPRGDDAFVDVGAITLPAKPQYCIRDANGEPIEYMHVALLRRGFVAIERLGQSFSQVPLLSDGHVPMLDLQDGDVLHVTPNETQPEVVDGQNVYTVPARLLVQGQGPWNFTMPNGQLKVNVRCADDESKPVQMYMSDLDLTIYEPTLFRGLVPGRHRCIFAAEGHQTAIVNVDVPAQGMAEIEVKLPKR
jgi:hypothetical protein